MGLRGPAPKPTASKKREGTHRADRAPKNEPTPEIAAPDCPPGVADDPDAKGYWDSLVPQLVAEGLLSRIDSASLEGLCRSYSVAVRADRLLAKGVTHITPWGEQVHPAVAISRNAWTEVRKFASEFGLTPAARSRVNAQPKPKKENTPATFLFGGGKVAGAITPR
jgi:P27 family predicted phage terminase small subunit